MHNRRVGAWGENLAAEYLEKLGYEILARNVRTEGGEIDLIARKDGVLSFVEVKARSSARFGFPEEAIDSLKRQHMEDAAELWLSSHPEENGKWQLEVISIQKNPASGRISIAQLEGNLD